MQAMVMPSVVRSTAPSEWRPAAGWIDTRYGMALPAWHASSRICVLWIPAHGRRKRTHWRVQVRRGGAWRDVAGAFFSERRARRHALRVLRAQQAREVCRV